jgi:NAD(P)-dependent dehydrogenase (short-subunit alcohol dehydrogenase family)
MAGLLVDKVALVTGAARGIGRAAAEAFAREGARVVLADLRDDEGEPVAAALRGAGADARFHRADVSNEGEVAELIRHCVDAHGRLDCAVNNAGITGAAGMLHDIPLDGFEQTLAVNLVGVFLCMKHEIRQMLAQGGGGAIVNTASGAGLIAVPGLSPYCASKHAVLGLTKTAAVENARTGIRVNAICPGAIDTPMLRASIAGNAEIEKLVTRSQPGGRLGRPEEVAQAAVWLCSDRASFVSGESMLVDAAAIAR